MAHLAAVQIDWGQIDLKKLSYVCDLKGADHAKPTRQLKNDTYEPSWIGVKKLASLT